MRLLLLTSLAGATCLVAPASAQSFDIGQHVRAAPSQIEAWWEESCTVVDGPNGNGWYQVECRDSLYWVPPKWMKPAAGATLPAAPTRPAAPLPSLAERMSRPRPAPLPSLAERMAQPAPPQPRPWERPRPDPAPPPAPRPPQPPEPPPPPSAAPQPAPTPGDNAAGGPPGSIPKGAYECWYFNEARLLLNFTVTGPGSYRASDGSTGSFSYDKTSGAMRFTGYLAESMPDGFIAVYHEPEGLPTVSFRSPRGSEASFCEIKR